MGLRHYNDRRKRTNVEWKKQHERKGTMNEKYKIELTRFGFQDIYI